MKKSFFPIITIVALKLGAGHAAGQEIVLSDPLNGSTVGTERGSGTFVTGGGWKSEGGRIIFDAGRLIENGFFEAKMRGWSAPTGGEGKSHPLSGWEEKDRYDRSTQNGSYWNLRIGSRYGTPEREYPYKVLAKPDTSDDRVEIGLGHKDDVNDGNPHTYRVAWENGTLSIYFDGHLMHSWSFHRFKQRYFVIGRDDNYGITDPAPIISDVLIGDFGASPAEDRWVQIAPAVSPGNRQYHDMAFVGDNQVLLFGGRTTAPDNETWLFYGSQKTWSRLVPQGSIPASRSGHAMAHLGGDQVMLFGGITGNLNGETWIYKKSENTWTRKFPSSAPSPRRYPAMAYIGGNKALLFGGNDGRHNNETWIYDAGDHAWTRMTPPLSPSAREGHCMAYIGQDRVLLFGGNANGIFSDETWVYDLSDNEWTLLTPASYIPSKRGYLDAAYLGDGRVLIVGGYHTHYYSKAHIFDLDELTWESVSSADAPSARVGHKVAETRMDGSGSLVLFGGEHTGTYYGDTWLFPQIGSAPNLPPQITSSESVTAYADSLFEYTARAVDPEGDPVVFTFIEYPSWMSPSDSVISGTPGSQDRDTLFQFIASDGQTADTATVSVSVVHFNQPPRITSPTQVTAYADSQFIYMAEATDPDDAVLQYHFTRYASWMTPQGTFITGTPPRGAPDTSFVLIVSDGEKADSVTVSVEVITLNARPRITGIGGIEFPNNQVYHIDLDSCVVDEDNPKEALAWQVYADVTPIIVQLVDRQVSLAAPGWSGSSQLTFIVTDPHMAADTLRVPVTVTLPSNINEEQGIPDRFALHANYPNPFNPSTAIRYDLPASSHVRLSVFNMRGEEVAVLKDEKQAAGTHTVLWQAADGEGRRLPSGLYLMRFQAAGRTFTRKMMFIQ